MTYEKCHLCPHCQIRYTDKVSMNDFGEVHVSSYGAAIYCRITGEMLLITKCVEASNDSSRYRSCSK